MSQVYVLHDEYEVFASGTVEDIAKTMGILTRTVEDYIKYPQLIQKKITPIKQYKAKFTESNTPISNVKVPKTETIFTLLKNETVIVIALNKATTLVYKVMLIKGLILPSSVLTSTFIVNQMRKTANKIFNKTKIIFYLSIFATSIVTSSRSFLSPL